MERGSVGFFPFSPSQLRNPENPVVIVRKHQKKKWEYKNAHHIA